MGRTQLGSLGGSSSPCLGTGSSPPCSGTLSQRLLSPVFGTSPLPTALPPGEQVGGSAPQPPPRCLIFLSLFLVARGNPLVPRPKSTTCLLLLLPRFGSGNLRGARSSAFGHPSGPAHAPGSRAHGPAGTEHAWEPRPRKPPPKGRSISWGPRRFPSWYWPGEPSARF